MLRTYAGSTAYDTACLLGFRTVKEQLTAGGAERSTFWETLVCAAEQQGDTVDDGQYLSFDEDGVLMALRNWSYDLVLDEQELLQ